MSTIWQSPTPGQATIVGHVNQLLMAHASLFTYNGAVINTDPTLTGSATALGSNLLAQAFTIGSPVNLGRIDLALGAIGAGQDVLVTLQADSGGAPSGTPLVGILVPPEWLPTGVASGASVYTLPLPADLAAGNYWIVLQPGSNLFGGFSQALAGVNDVQWTRTTAASGAAIYSSGSWANQSYGFGLYLRDNTGTLLRAITDDAVPSLSFALPAKAAAYNYSSGQLSNAYEWVARSLGINPTLLCRDDASFEVSVGSAAAVANATLARSNAAALDGLWSLKMTATALGNMSARIGPYPVTAGATYSWVAAFLAGSSLESAYAAVEWYDGATLLSTSNGEAVTTSETVWNASVGTAAAPATATDAYVVFVVENAPASSIFYVDGVGLFEGPSAVWSYPGVGFASLRTLTYVNGELSEAT